MSVLVATPDRLDASWARSVLRRHAPDATVRAVETVGVDVGTTTRVRLRVDHDAPGVATRWFVKLPSGLWKARAITTLPRLPQTEVRFYGEVAPDVPVARPALLAAEARLGRGFTLVIGDVTEQGAAAGRPGDAIDAARAGRVVELLGRLHARLWESPLLSRGLAWLDGPVRRLEDGLGTALAVPLMKRGLDRAGDAIPERLRGPALEWARARRGVMAALGRGPRTLVHHDCHTGNLFWQPDGAPGLLDWQLVRVGEGIGDVAYLLGTGLEPAERAACERDLLARWADALAAAGGPRLPAAGLEQRYRAHLTYAFEAMAVTLAIGGLMKDEVARTLVSRAAAAVAHHDAFGAARVLAGA